MIFASGGERLAAAGLLGIAAGIAVIPLRHVVPHALLRVGPGGMHTLAGWFLGAVAGSLGALALRDPFVAGLGLALGWGGGRLFGRLSELHGNLRETQAATRLLQQVVEEAAVGMDPLAALRRAAVRLPSHHPVRLRSQALLARVDEGQALQHAAKAWAEAEPVPTLRMFARLLSAWSVWGLDLRAGLSRILREGQQSVAFGKEEAIERSAYEWLTWLFLGADIALGVWALISWPHSVAAPTRTRWGHALLLLSALATALAVSLPAALEAGSATGGAAGSAASDAAGGLGQ